MVGQSEGVKAQSISENEDGDVWDACCEIAATAAATVEDANMVANTLLVELEALALVADALKHVAADVGGESPIGFSANSATRNEKKNEKRKRIKQKRNKGLKDTNGVIQKPTRVIIKEGTFYMNKEDDANEVNSLNRKALQVKARSNNGILSLKSQIPFISFSIFELSS